MGFMHIKQARFSMNARIKTRLLIFRSRLSRLKETALILHKTRLNSSSYKDKWAKITLSGSFLEISMKQLARLRAIACLKVHFLKVLCSKAKRKILV